MSNPTAYNDAPHLNDAQLAYFYEAMNGDSDRSAPCTLSTPISDSVSRGGSRFGVINDSPEQRLDSGSVPRTMPTLISDSTSRGGSRDSVGAVNRERLLHCFICAIPLRGRDWVHHCAEHCAQHFETDHPLRCPCFHDFESWELLFSHILRGIHDDENEETYGICGEDVRRQLSLGPQTNSGASGRHRDRILRRDSTPTAYTLYRNETSYMGAWANGRPDGNDNDA